MRVTKHICDRCKGEFPEKDLIETVVQFRDLGQVHLSNRGYVFNPKPVAHFCREKCAKELSIPPLYASKEQQENAITVEDLLREMVRDAVEEMQGKL